TRRGFLPILTLGRGVNRGEDTVHRRVRLRAATLLVPIVALVFCGAAAGLSGGAAGAAGILPPANPSANIAPDSSDWLTAIDDARAQEGVGPMDLTEASLSELPVPEQVFAIVNSERVDRGLPPIDDMTAQLNLYAQGGANAGNDPTIPSSLTGGAPITWGGGIWAGGLTSPLEADYYWMYDDGWSGASTTNSACSQSDISGCWGHRDIILHEFGGCPTGPAVLSMGAAFSPSGYADGSLTAVVVGSCAAPTDVTATWGQVAQTVESSARTVGIASLADGSGYWEVEANGTVGAFGAAHDYGSISTSLNSPIVGMAATPDGGGYWLVASDGGIFSFGDAAFYGSMGGRALNQPIVGMAADATTGGYWIVAADGGVFAFHAPFLGSTGGLVLNRPIVGMEALPDGQGYRFVASDGGIFSFGQAPFDGSTGGMTLAAPVVDMAADNPTGGYWMAAADGGVFTFGGASYLGRLVSS
ncbi:MAG TPA: hypothetical protein VEH29_04805, partial [Acidimicrobiales bacterium]|nr:hypothetical protein [Acidimicrobiales bacterium]